MKILATTKRRHTLRMRESIAREIAAAGGWISFERYMDLALYEPGLGYYSAGARKLGAGGDFTTAPEISSLFGACVAKQCAEVLRAVREGSILEVGAGTGRGGRAILASGIAARLPARYLHSRGQRRSAGAAARLCARCRICATESCGSTRCPSPSTV